MPHPTLRLALLWFVLVAPAGPACKGAGESEPAEPAVTGPSDDPKRPEDPKDPVPPAEPIAFDEIVYRFQDASVPPPHHRSVTITAKVGSILRVVDSYGDEIERQEGTLDQAAFDALAKAFNEADIRRLPDGVGVAGCTGGTSESVRLSKAGKPVFTGTIDHCGGSDTPDFQGDLGPFIDAVKASAPSGPAPTIAPTEAGKD